MNAAWVRASLAAAALLLVARDAKADGPEGVALFPRTGYQRAGVEVETAGFRVDGQRGSYASAVARVEWVPINHFELRARVPAYTMTLDGEDSAREGLGDAELRLRYHVRSSEPLQISVGWLTQFPTGSNHQGLGAGAMQATPFVNAGFRTGKLVVYATIADALTIASAHRTRYVEYVDPNTDHELRGILGTIYSFSDTVAASAILSTATVLTEADRGRSLMTAALQLGTQPDKKLRLVLTPQVPVLGEHRFDWKLNATASYAF